MTHEHSMFGLQIFVSICAVCFAVFGILYSVWASLASKDAIPRICKTLKTLCGAVTFIYIINMFCASLTGFYFVDSIETSISLPYILLIAGLGISLFVFALINIIIVIGMK